MIKEILKESLSELKDYFSSIRMELKFYIFSSTLLRI